MILLFLQLQALFFIILGGKEGIYAFILVLFTLFLSLFYACL